MFKTYLIRADGYGFEPVSFEDRNDAISHIEELRQLSMYRSVRIHLICVVWHDGDGTEVDSVETYAP